MNFNIYIYFKIKMAVILYIYIYKINTLKILQVDVYFQLKNSAKRETEKKIECGQII